MGEVRGWEVVVLLSYFCLLAEEELVEGVYSGASCDEHEARCGDDADELNDGCSWRCDGSGWDAHALEGLSGAVDGPFGELLSTVGDEDYAQDDVGCEYGE